MKEKEVGQVVTKTSITLVHNAGHLHQLKKEKKTSTSLAAMTRIGMHFFNQTLRGENHLMALKYMGMKE